MLTKEEIEQNKDYFNFLENLRKSGVTNMFGAGPYLEVAFTMLPKKADAILGLWMDNYSQLNKELSWGR